MSSSASLQGGCFLGEDYRHFHHGSFFQSEPIRNLQQNISSTFVSPATAWVYEDGAFQPLQNPLPPACDGPGCRSNPIEDQWGQPYTTADASRIVPVRGSDDVCIGCRRDSGLVSLGKNEFPCTIDNLFIDRPPKISGCH